MNTLRMALLLCTTLLFLSGCGQKGPLYLPEAKPTPQSEKSK
ncbi:LPS translocon maturation chaperone LptM [Legionella shakespearei]|nr:lipoprotein [Legionella shakespearei]